MLAELGLKAFFCRFLSFLDISKQQLPKDPKEKR